MEGYVNRLERESFMNLAQYMEDRTDDVNRQVEEFVQGKVPNDMMAMAAVMLTGGKRLRQRCSARIRECVRVWWWARMGGFRRR